MAVWPNTATAILDLRRQLSDGPKDRLVKSKKVLSPADGVNKTFFTLEDRVVSPVAGSPFASPGIQVTLDYVAVPAVDITVDDYLTGQFTLATAPEGTADVRAAYAYQYFLDEELDEALKLSAGQIISSEDYTLIADGFKFAALYFGSHFAYQKQSVRWMERLSHKFMLEEEPLQTEVLARSNLFQTLADKFWDRAVRARDDFYTRQGRRNAPAFARYAPRIPPIGPVT